MILRDRLQWMLRMTLLLFILCSVAFLSALTAMRFAVQGREVAIPDLVGKSSAQANDILQGRGIGMKVEDRIYNSLPVDAVVRQSPPPGMRVKVGANAHLVLSLGPQRVTIPVLTDRSMRAAQVELLRDGMQLGEVSSVYLPDSEQDVVAQQDPAPGKSDVTSPHVNVLVALGPRPPAYVMPPLVGLPAAEAQSQLTSAGLKVSRLTPAPAPDRPSGTVIAQAPARGQRVDADTAIELQVAQ